MWLFGSFFFCRMCTITALVAHAAYAWWVLAFVQSLYWSRPVSDRLLFGGLTVLLLVHFALNVFWFNKIAGHARRAFKRYGPIAQKERAAMEEEERTGPAKMRHLSAKMKEVEAMKSKLRSTNKKKAS